MQRRRLHVYKGSYLERVIEMARPTRYSERFIDVARDITNDGGTLDDVAKKIGVDRKTVLQWMERYEPFNHAISKGREIASEKVVESLYRRAVGYEATETKIIELPGGKQRVETITKDISPNVTAIAMWLNNVLPGKWRDKREVELKSNRPIMIGDEYMPMMDNAVKAQVQESKGDDDGV